MGVNLWDGKTLSAWIDKQYSIRVGVRQETTKIRGSGR